MEYYDSRWLLTHTDSAIPTDDNYDEDQGQAEGGGLVDIIQSVDNVLASSTSSASSAYDTSNVFAINGINCTPQDYYAYSEGSNWFFIVRGNTALLVANGVTLASGSWGTSICPFTIPDQFAPKIQVWTSCIVENYPTYTRGMVVQTDGSAYVGQFGGTDVGSSVTVRGSATWPVKFKKTDGTNY